jgi:hypothetical protein
MSRHHEQPANIVRQRINYCRRWVETIAAESPFDPDNARLRAFCI